MWLSLLKLYSVCGNKDVEISSFDLGKYSTIQQPLTTLEHLLHMQTSLILQIKTTKNQVQVLPQLKSWLQKRSIINCVISFPPHFLQSKHFINWLLPTVCKRKNSFSSFMILHHVTLHSLSIKWRKLYTSNSAHGFQYLHTVYRCVQNELNMNYVRLNVCALKHVEELLQMCISTALCGIKCLWQMIQALH